jgi:protein-S-isoprenylcysteine O-methyltransferase Ste14
VNRKTRSILGSLLFFCVAPAVVAGWVPFRITGWRLGPSPLGLPALRWAGAALAAIGTAGLVDCFARFALQGLGTPAPVAPTQYLVSGGLYRHVRNPMYVSLVAAIVGQGLLLGSPRLLGYAVIVFLLVHAFVLAYEEPALRRTFGESYERYRANGPRWWPRLRPWRDADRCLCC